MKYSDLVNMFPLRPIRSKWKCNQAIKVLDSLVDKGKRNRDEEDYFEVLSFLVWTWEEHNLPKPTIASAEMLRNLLDASGKTQTQVAMASGMSQATLSHLVNGKRSISIKHARKLAECFKVGISAFID